MDVVTGIAWLILILSVLVIAHEWGHFIVAKLFKMRVDEFSLFFGPPLLQLGKWHDTEYNIRSFPLGGYVKIAGMEADDISGGRPILEAIRSPQQEHQSMDDILRKLKSDTMNDVNVENIGAELRDRVRNSIGEDGLLTSEARKDFQALRLSPQVNADEMKFLDMALSSDEHLRDKGLYSNKPLYQRALVIFAGPFMSCFFGYLLFVFMGMTLGMPSMSRSTNQIQVIPNGAAEMAGLRTGDRIIAIDGKPTPNGTALKNIIHNAPNHPMRFRIDREGHVFDVLMKPKPFTFTDVVNGVKVKKTIGLIGVYPNPVFVRVGLIESIRGGTIGTINTIYELLTGLFSKNVKNNVGGPIMIGEMTISLQRLGVARLVEMGGMLSLSLGVMNLLPIPILDGGHLLLLGIEKIRRRKLSAKEIYRAQMVGLGLLGILICMVMYNDLIRTISGKGFQ